MDGEIWIIETYDSLLKSHMAVKICTVSYVEYFANFLQIIFGGAIRSNKWRLNELRNKYFRSRKLEEGGGGADDVSYQGGTIEFGEGGEKYLKGRRGG